MKKTSKQKKCAVPAGIKNMIDYRKLFNESRDGIVLIDSRNGCIVHCNPEFERQTGRNLKELVKMKIWAIRPAEKIKLAKKKFFDIKKKGTGGSGELEFQKPDGTNVPVEFRTKVIDIGGIQYMQSVTNDMTEHQKIEKALRKSEETLRSIISSMDDLVLTLDKNGIFLNYYQRENTENLYAPPEVFVGKVYRKILPPDASKLLRDSLKALVATGKSQQIDYLMAINGEERWFSATISMRRNSDGKFDGATIVSRDITERKKIERAKTEFVSMASHQLRTPPTAIMWYTDMLLKEDIGKINKQQRLYLEEINHNNQRMISLVRALLNISRIELGSFEVKTRAMNPIRIINDVLDALEPQITNKKLKVTKSYDKKPPNIHIDPKLLNIVLQNLISDAIQFTPDKGRIKLAIKKQKSDVLIEVSDTGCGIPKKQQPKIFTKFFRADNAVKRYPDGSGLGLYIAKSLTEAMGGKISFKSELGKGTTFFLAFPVKKLRKKQE